MIDFFKDFSLLLLQRPHTSWFDLASMAGNIPPSLEQDFVDLSEDLLELQSQIGLIAALATVINFWNGIGLTDTAWLPVAIAISWVLLGLFHMVSYTGLHDSRCKNPVYYVPYNGTMKLVQHANFWAWAHTIFLSVQIYFFFSEQAPKSNAHSSIVCSHSYWYLVYSRKMWVHEVYCLPNKRDPIFCR